MYTYILLTFPFAFSYAVTVRTAKVLLLLYSSTQWPYPLYTLLMGLKMTINVLWFQRFIAGSVTNSWGCRGSP